VFKKACPNLKSEREYGVYSITMPVGMLTGRGSL